MPTLGVKAALMGIPGAQQYLQSSPATLKPTLPSFPAVRQGHMANLADVLQGQWHWTCFQEAAFKSNVLHPR